MWMPAGVLGLIRCLPRRAAGWIHSRRNTPMRMAITMTAKRTGSTPMMAPQSGVTNSAVSWRRRVQIRSSSMAQAMRVGRPPAIPITRPTTRRRGRRP